jgi:hypothetical protein
MITYFEAKLSALSVHKIGNKASGESLLLSDGSLPLQDEILQGLLMKYFVGKFEKTQEIFRFTHSSGELALNEVYQFSRRIFSNPQTLHENSVSIARYLFNVANHPNIKGGELYVAYLKDLQMEGELFDAIGIFKSEAKEPFLKIKQVGEAFEIDFEESAININKLDKGCLIFNVEQDEGYRVAALDSTNRSEAYYWVDQFLQLTARNDSYNKTQQILTVYKTFVEEKLDDQYSLDRAEKIDMLNRSMKYFKEREHFNVTEFTDEVIGEPGAIKLFNSFRQEYEKDVSADIGESFAISPDAVKKQAKWFKRVLKLDRNFHIYIHGDKDLIEKGYDETKGLSYYKVYFKEEN